MNLKNKLMRTVVVATLCVAASAAAQAVPQQLSFTANLSNTAGAPATGNHSFVFTLYDAVTAGNPTWTETQASVPVTNGLVFTRLGLTTPLTPLIFNGAQLWLEVSVDGTPLTPRAPIASVPYAIRAGVATSAESIGPLLASEVQKRINGSCVGANALQSIDADGGVGCVSIAGGTGDVTAVNTSGTSGLVGGALSGDINLSLASCPVNQILKSTGSGAWSCQADSLGAGTVTSVATGAGLTGGPITGAGTVALMSCPATQILVSSGAGWACAAPTAEAHLGDVVSVNATLNGGLVAGGTATAPTLGMPAGCAIGSVMRWNGTAWICTAVTAGTVTSVGAGNGLTGGPITAAGTLGIDADATQFSFFANKLTLVSLPATDNGYIRNQSVATQGATFNIGGTGVAGILRAGAYGYTAPQTGYYAMGARSFQPEPSSAAYWKWMSGVNYTYLSQPGCTTGSRCTINLTSQVHLPQNATVTLIECTLYDQALSNSVQLTANLFRNAGSAVFDRVSVGGLGTVVTTGTGFGNAPQTFSGAVSHVINNSASYELELTYASDYPLDNAQMVFTGCRITYTYTSIEH